MPGSICSELALFLCRTGKAIPVGSSRRDTFCFSVHRQLRPRIPRRTIATAGRFLPTSSRSAFECGTSFTHRHGRRNFRRLTAAVAEMSTLPPASGAETLDDGKAADEEGISYREQKLAMRKQIKAKLKSMEQSTVGDGTRAVAERLLATPQLQASSETRAVSVYLSMPGELGTAALVSELFRREKKVYIPKVLGPASADMRMFPLESDEEAATFPLTKWKIPEPPEELVLSREDGTYAGDIDVVIVPAMAFDERCNRLGHGRGYYDCFFERIKESNAEKGQPPPVTLGVCFDEQVVDSVPTSSSDVPLDFVFTPTRTFEREARDNL